MLETPIEVYPSNGEVVDWKENPPFTFRLKGDNVSYATCEIYNLATNESRVTKHFELFKNRNGSYNNEIVSLPLSNTFNIDDAGKDYKYRYLISQQNPYTANLDKDGSFGLYRIEQGRFVISASHPNKVDVWDTINLPFVPASIFCTLAEFENDDKVIHKFTNNQQVSSTVSLYLAKLYYEDDSTIYKYFSTFSCKDRYIKTTSEIKDHNSVVAIELYVCINSVNPNIYIGRNTLASKPQNSFVSDSNALRTAGLSWVVIDNSIPNYQPASRWMGSSVGNLGRTPYGVYRGMFVKIGDEIRMIKSYRAIYNSTSNNTQYWLCFQPPLPENPSLNTPIEFYTNYIVTPWYDFKCRKKPTTELTIERNPDTGFLKCKSSYSQIDNVSLKSYNFSIFDSTHINCIATTNNQYSYRQDWEFPLPTLTISYSVDGLLTSQEGDSVHISRRFSKANCIFKNISTVRVNDEKCLGNLTWSAYDFISGQGYAGRRFNIYRKVDNGKTGISATDDFVFIGTTQDFHFTDYTVGNNQSYCYQIENSGENNNGYASLDLIFVAKSYYNEEAQANTPFANENYEYITPVKSSSGVFSEPFLLTNGSYRAVVTATNKPQNIKLVIYNPYYGCYYYNDDEYIDLEWRQQGDKYICDFEVKTDYKQNYVMLGDPSNSMNTWNKRNFKLYQSPSYTYLYTDPIISDWDGWSISSLIRMDDFYGLHQYEIGDTWRFYAELNEPTITMQNDFQIHNGTSQYGQISRGNNNYDSGTFTSYILEMDCDNGIIYDDIQKVKAWKKFIYDNEAFLLKSSKGDVWIVGITDSPTRQYEQGMNEPTIVSYNWVEIDDVRKAIIVD